jgi:hypothetical protein
VGNQTIEGAGRIAAASNQMTAFLPFMVEDYFDGGSQRRRGQAQA